MDRTTGKVTVLRRFSTRYQQVISIAGDDGWVAWVEASVQPSFADWSLYSYDRHTGQIRMLTAAPKSLPSTPWLAISMSHGIIVWSADSGDGILRVYAINANGSGLRVIAKDARGPQIAYPWVMYDVKPITAGAPARLVRQNLETGEIRQVPGPADASYFAYDGEALAWIPLNTSQIYLQAPLDSAPIELHPGGGRYFQFPTINHRLVGWGQYEGAFVYDRKLHVVVRLSKLQLSYPVMSDQALDWGNQSDPSASNASAGTVWRDVNISDLP